MKKDEIKDILYTSKGLIVSKLLDYVRQHGTDVTDYERNAFGLDDEDECKISKVLNFADDKGCYFSLPNRANIEEEYNQETAFDLLMRLEEKFTFYAVQCLYVMEDRYGREYLMSYCLFNGGVRFLDDLSEPSHESMLNEPIEYVSMIADVVLKTME